MSPQKCLLDILNNESEPFDNRLKIASCKFTSVDSNLVRNREIILHWLKSKLFDKHCGPTERNSILSALKLCIVAVTDIFLNPQLADPILEILLQDPENEVELLECTREALGSIHFIKYFVNRIPKFAELVSRCIHVIKTTNDLSDGDRNTLSSVILNAILYIKNHSFQLHELKLVFVRSLIEPLAELALTRENKNVSSFQEIFYQILFTDVSFRKTFVSNIFSTDGEEFSSSLIIVIRNYPTYLRAELVKSAYSLIFRGFLLSAANSNAKFRVFLALNSFIYMRPIPLGDEHPKCVMFNENIQTCNELLELLLRNNILLDSTTQSITIMEWLKALIDVVLSEIKNNFTCSVIQLLENALSFSPILIENCLRKFTKNVMLLKKTDPLVVEKYSALCLHILNVHVKLNRMHKLISALLITVKENLEDFRPEDLPNKFDILPERIFDQIQSAVTNLPSTVQNVALLNALLYHLENDCIAVLEKQKSKEIDPGHILLFDIVSYLISRFISGTRIMDYSVPEMVKEKFVSLMKNLEALLKRYGEVIISKKHDPELVECFLYLCTVWGDMQIVFMTYESASRKITKQVGATGNAPTNLVYLHPYLTDYHWTLIAQRVANFGNENCVRQLNTLVLQKIHALPYLEDEIEGPYLENIHGDGPAVLSAQYLADQMDHKWIFHHVSEFVHLLKPITILKLSKVLVKYCENCDNVEISRVLSSNFRETRPLVLAMAHCTFHNMSKTLTKFNSKEVKRIIRRLDYEEMVSVEIEESSDATLETKLNEVGLLVSSNFVYTEFPGNINASSLERDLDILSSLPTQYLRSENKSIVCMLVICLIKSLIQLRRNNDSLGKVIENSATFLQSMLTDITLPCSLDCGKVLVWFYCGLKNTLGCDWTMRKLCEAQPNYDSGVDSVIEMVKAAVGGQSPCDALIQSCNEGIDLVTSYLINFQKARKRKNDDSALEVVHKLRRLCYENFDEIFNLAPKEYNNRRKQLALFNLLLNEALQSDNKGHMLQLSTHLAEFIVFMEENSDSVCEEISQLLFTILRYVKELKSCLPDRFIVTAWACRWYTSEDEVIKAFLRRASLEEYEEMIDLLLAHTEGSLEGCEVSESTVISRVWKLVLNTSVKLKKTQIRKRAVSELCALARTHTTVAGSGQDVINRVYVQIFTAVLQNSEIHLRYQTIDLCFDLIASTVNADCSDELLVECVEMLFVFCLIWRSMLLDRIPTFYLCYKSLFAIIVHRASDTTCRNVEFLSCAVHKLEKLTDNLVKWKKDFTKTAISAVSDLVNMVADVRVENKLDNHLKNIIYCWIGMCDPHGLQFLSTAMSPVAQNLLKQYQSEYKKFYKFTGKV